MCFSFLTLTTDGFFLYRGVGFLRYFQLKQLPNFLLASPILSLALCSIIHYMKLQPEFFFSLGFRASPEEKKSAAVLFSLGVDNRSKNDQFSEKSIRKTQGILCQNLSCELPFWYHNFVSVNHFESNFMCCKQLCNGSSLKPSRILFFKQTSHSKVFCLNSKLYNLALFRDIILNPFYFHTSIEFS